MEGPPHVVHVDDDPAVLDLTATFLETRDNFEVTSTTDPEEAMAALDDVECVVSDLDMRSMDGLTFLDAVRDENPGLPFILFTGDGSEAVASRAISAGVTDYLQKGGGREQYALLARRVRNAVDRWRAERALVESERRLATLIDNLPGVAYRCRNTPGWPMEFVSEACTRLTGHDPDDFESDAVSWGRDVIHPDDRDPVWEAVQEAIPERDPFRVIYRIRTRDGETRWVWERGRAVYEGDDVVALEGIITDITGPQRYRRRLERENDRLRDLADLVAGDVAEAVDRATRRLDDRRGDDDGLDRVTAAFARLEALVADATALAAPRTGDPSTIDFPALVREAWAVSGVGVEGATLVVRDPPTTVSADVDRLRRLLRALFVDAVADVVGPTVVVDGIEGGFYVESQDANGERRDGATVGGENERLAAALGWTTTRDDARIEVRFRSSSTVASMRRWPGDAEYAGDRFSR